MRAKRSLWKGRSPLELWPAKGRLRRGLGYGWHASKSATRKPPMETGRQTGWLFSDTPPALADDLSNLGTFYNAATGIASLIPTLTCSAARDW